MEAIVLSEPKLTSSLTYIVAYGTAKPSLLSSQPKNSIVSPAAAPEGRGSR